MVAGGTGIVGSGIVSALVQNGAKCWIPSRSEAKFDALKQTISAQFHSHLSLFKADLSSESDGVALREEILRQDGKLHHVVSSNSNKT